MSKSGKSSNAQKSRRKVQTSGARNRKTVTRPTYAKKASNPSQKRTGVKASQIKSNKSSKVEESSHPKKADRTIEAQRKQENTNTNTALMVVERPKNDNIVAEEIVEIKKNQDSKSIQEEPESRKKSNDKRESRVKGDTKDEKKTETKKELVAKEKSVAVKINFVENNETKIEKRPLGSTTQNVDIMQSPKIQHFAEVSEETVLAEMDQVGKTISESVALEQALSNFETEHPEVSEQPLVSDFDIKRINQRLEERKVAAGSSEERISAKTTERTAKDIKEEAIRKAVASVSAQEKNFQKNHRIRKVNFGFKRVVLALACATAAVFAIVYFADLNAPDVSLKVAAMQSGIDASYPSYVPRDFNLSDITSENGKITLNFRNGNSGDAFTLIEENLTGSSTSATEYARNTYGDDYTVMEEQGLTLYLTSRAACWTKGKTFYRLNVTSGSLTKKQIKGIATSL